jgi:hypothetical protein
VTLPPGLTIVTLTVSDGHISATDTVDINVVDTTPPGVTIIIPQANTALQDTVTLTADASDITGIDKVYFYVREPGGANGTPIGYEALEGSFNTTSGLWEYVFDTTDLDDGAYIILANAIDLSGNVGWSQVTAFSIQNWAVLELLPSSEKNKAGRTMPIKFSLIIDESVDTDQPFVYNEDLEIRIYKVAGNKNTLLQTSVYGSSSTDYRIDTFSELYITNFKTEKNPANYLVEIWRKDKNIFVGSFTFKTVK